jgi:SAM-dependent methyltransferase
VTGGEAAACRVCGHAAGNRALRLREMMFGTGEGFGYTACAGCGSIQIDQVPADLGRHYPSDYYAYAPPAAAPGWKLALKRSRARAVLGGGGVLGALVSRVTGRPEYLDWVREAGLGPASRVLDVGSGGGVVLRELHLAGFTRLTGVDPFLPGDDEPLPGLRLLRREVGEVRGEFDFVMLNHSFEHMPDSAAVLRALRGLVAPGGVVMIRIPLAGRYAGRTYGDDWVQLDPPRHLVIHTEAGMQHLARGAGFRIERVVYDSTALQFWGSELYRRGMSLMDPATRRPRDPAAVFGRRQVREWERRAAELNQAGDGDQAAFYLRPA